MKKSRFKAVPVEKPRSAPCDLLPDRIFQRRPSRDRSLPGGADHRQDVVVRAAS
jgi:hypothetical protein